MRWSAVAVVMLMMAGSLWGQRQLRESFTGGLGALREAGWQVPGKGIDSEADGLKVTSEGRQFIKLDVPVKPGESYRGSVMVKSLDVKQGKPVDRGSTMYFGFLDAKKDWINGGEFPSGPLGDSEWTKIEIKATRPIPKEVAYIQVWIGIDGIGSALYRDFEMASLDAEPAVLTVDAGANPPSFALPLHPWLEGQQRRHRRLRVLLSQDPAFPPEATYEFLGTGPRLTPEYALAGGAWHALGMWCDSRGEYLHAQASFALAEPAPGFRRRVTASFPNGRYAAQAELTLSFYPPLAVDRELQLSFGDLPATVLARTADAVRFRAASPLPAGHWPVKLVVDGQEYVDYYVNKEPANTFSFRDDLMLLVNGKPFFPIGTYRDPSDDIWEFAGIREAGFNLTHTYHFEDRTWGVDEARRYLRACAENGVMTFLGLNRQLMKQGNWREIAFRCGELYDEPGLLTWYLADEPTGWIDKFSFTVISNAVRRAVPGVPRTLLMCECGVNNPLLRYYGNRQSEIYWFDSYPVGRSPLITVRKDMLASRQLASPEQPVWAVIQAFDWLNRKVKEMNMKPEDFEPKAGKIRCMTHLALTADVQGIIFYWLPKDRYDFRHDSPIQWEEVKATTRELHELMPFLTGRIEKLPESAVPAAPCEYWQRRAADGRQVLVLVNPEDHAIDVELKAPGLARKVSLPPYGVETIVY